MFAGITGSHDLGGRLIMLDIVLDDRIDDFVGRQIILVGLVRPEFS